jgi:prephenate dehydratase
LSYFNDEKINLSKIESRPSREKLGNYLFYIELDGNARDKKVKHAFNNIKKNIGSIKILGCYSSRV